MTALDTVFAELPGRPRKSGDGWVTECPAHDDMNPSLSIKSVDGRVLLNCHTGCHTQDVLLALGLDWPDLFDEPIKGPGVTVAEWTYTDRRGDPYMVVERIQKPTGKSFAQRLPGKVKYGLDGQQPCLYRLPQVFAAIESGQEIWIVEGEKCVHAMERLGVTATCAPGGAGTGKWKDYYSGWLTEGKGCIRANIVVDNDDVGRQYGAEIAVSLRGKGIPVSTYEVAVTAPKADIYDHVLAGKGLDDLRPVKLDRLRPAGITLAELMSIEYPPVRWAVQGILPAGFAILGGPPKQAKSMCVLDMALGVAHGGRALSELRCEQGSVLYLSLDNDSERRLQYRIEYLLGDRLNPTTPIEFHVDWPTGDAAVKACQEWVDDELDARRPPLLVVIDTLGKVEPNFEGGGYENAYLASTSNLSRWAKFATENELAVLAVHHDRKSGNRKGDEDGDWLDRFTGSRGITATASTLMMLDAKRGEPQGWLRVAGRDIETDDLELHRSGWAWVCIDQPTTGLRVVGS